MRLVLIFNRSKDLKIQGGIRNHDLGCIMPLFYPTELLAINKNGFLFLRLPNCQNKIDLFLHFEGFFNDLHEHSC